MTISSDRQKKLLPKKMDRIKFTEPVTSESELEEGEINDDIEIISEIRRAPRSNSVPRPPRKAIPLNTSTKPQAVRVQAPPRNPPSSKNDRKSSNSSNGNSRSNRSGGACDKVRTRSSPFKGGNARAGANSSRSSGAGKRPASNPSGAGKSREKAVGSGGSSAQRDALALHLRGESNYIDEVMKWKSSFELVSNSVESMSISSEEDDEEMELRLAALNSVVLNAKKNTADSAPPSEPLPPTAQSPTEQEEDEDEELLRAQLLIEVAKKQTMEVMKPLPSASDLKPEPVTEETKPVEIKIQKPVPKVTPLMIPIPKAERLIIDLRPDSSDSSSEDEEENAVECSIDSLLKTARKTVEQKGAALPEAMARLPKHRQEEYQRLRQEILRRENNRLLQHGSKASPSPQQCSEEVAQETHPTIVVLDQNLTPAVNSSSQATAQEEASVGENVEVPPAGQAPSAKKSALKNGFPDVSKENVAANSPSSPNVKLAAFRNQIIHKKKDLAQSKEALKKQLELVDKQHALWLQSSQEVTRLKKMILQAEESEKTLRSQLTSSQQHTQRLKTRMQAVERSITLLQSGLSINRKRFPSTKFKMKSWSPNKSLGVSGLSPSPFKVKPKVLAKALARTGESATSSANLIRGSPASPVKNYSQILLEKRAGDSSQRKGLIHDEAWLFGTLGDEWDNPPESAKNFPTMSTSNHSIKSFNSDKFRLDPSRLVCRYDSADSACQDANCNFQHLPKSEACLRTSPISTTTASAAMAFSSLPGNQH